jgi:hypothetical protein
MQAPWASAEEIEQPERPHEEHRADRALVLPLSRRRRHAQAQARQPTPALQAAGELHVLHERDVGEPVERLERRPPHEDHLVAGRDAGQP